MPRSSLFARRSTQLAVGLSPAARFRAIREREAGYRHALDVAELGTWAFDAVAGQTKLDSRAQAIFGFESDRVDPNRFTELLHPDDLEGYLGALAKTADPERPVPFDLTYRIVLPDGTIKWIHGITTIQVGRAEDGTSPIRAIGVTRDVTEQVSAQLALSENEALLRRVIDNQLGFVGILDVAGLVIDVNHAALATARLSREDVAGLPFWECPWWNYDPCVASQIERAVRDAAAGKTSRFDVTAWISANGRLNVDFQMTPVYDHDGAVRYLIPSGMDVTERRRAEAALRRLNETLEARVAERTQQVGELSRALTLAEQEERRRIAYVLHEDLQQLLAAAGTLADLGDTKRVRALVDRSLAITRSLSHDLAPPLLDNEDLRGLLEWLVHISAERHGLHVALHIHDPIDIPEASLRALLYQALREVLFNVVKHAGTLLATLSAHDIGDHIQIEVSDRGCGFDTSGLTGGGLGLASVRERLERVGGRCSVQSEPGTGTQVTILVPIAPA